MNEPSIVYDYMIINNLVANDGVTANPLSGLPTGASRISLP